jgi:tape measure domain-containing protein
MASVDDRIVQMKFDNQKFESGVGQTMQTLDKLKGSLNFDQSKSSMQGLSDAASRFNLGGIGATIEGISGKFLALSTVGVTALVNITNKAIDAGIQLGKSLSVDQISSGFSEYETNIGSIQTILANTSSKGTTLDQVNSALDELNTYSDQTIYNFSQMTKNIGTFTAAGIDLGTSTAAIKGIANLAATSGSTAEQASSAMYQLSQALASGTVKLMDWNSIVNAGMGGEVFQKALFETGKSLHTIKGVKLDTTFEEWKKAGNTFRNSLQKGWLTADVLTNTLQGFTGDLSAAQLTALGYTEDQAVEMMKLGKTGKDAATKVKTLTQLLSTVKETVGSGWSASFRTIFGDFEEARTQFTLWNEQISNVVNKSAEARNKLLGDWKELGGRKMLITGITQAFQDVAAIIKPVRDAFHDVFPAITAQRLFDITKKFKELTDKFKIGADSAKTLRKIFRGLFSAIEIGFTIVKEVGRVFFNLFKALKDSQGSKAVDFFSNLADKLIRLNDTLVTKGGIRKFFEDIPGTIVNFINTVGGAGSTLDDFRKKVKEAVDAFVGGFLGTTAYLNGGIIGFLNVLGLKLGHIKDLLTGGALSSGIDSVSSDIGNMGGIFSSVWEVLKSFGKAFVHVVDVIIEAGKSIGRAISNLWAKIQEAFGSTQLDNVLSVVNTGLFGGLVVLFKRFMDGGVAAILGGTKFSQMIKGVTDTLSAMQTQLRSKALLNIAYALAVLTASIVVLSLIDAAALTKSLIAISVGFASLVASLGILLKLTGPLSSSGSFTIIATGLILLSVAMLILAVAVRVLSGLNVKEITTGMSGIAGMLVSLITAVKQLDGQRGGMIRAAAAMIGIALAMLLISLAVRSFATLSWEELGRGLVGIAGTLAVIIAAMKLMPEKAMIRIGVALIAVGIGLNILFLAVKLFATLDMGELMQGLIGIGSTLLVIAAAMLLMPSNLLLTGAGLLLVGVGLVAIASALSVLSLFTWETLAKSIGAVAVVLGVLAAATWAMSGTIAGSIAIGIASGAMLLMANALSVIGKLSWGEIIKGLTGMAGVLVVLGLAAVGASFILPALFGLGAALIVIGAGFALIGIGASALAKAFQIMAEAGSAGIKVVVELVTELINLVPKMVGSFAEGVLLLSNKILEQAPALIKNLAKLLIALLQGLREVLPELGKTIGELIDTLLKLLVDKTPDLVAAGWEILKALLKGMSDHVEEFTNMVVDIILKFVGALTDRADELATAGADLLVALINGITTNVQKIVDAAFDLLSAFIVGMTTGISRLTTEIEDLIVAIGTAIVGAAQTITDQAKLIMSAILGGMADAITAGAQEVKDLIIAICAAIVDTSTTLSEEVPKVVVAIFKAMVNATTEISDGMGDFIVAMCNSITAAIEKHAEPIAKAGGELAGAFTNAMVDAPVTGFQAFWQKIRPDSFFGEDDPFNVQGKAAGAAAVDGVVEGANSTESQQKLHDSGWGAFTNWQTGFNNAGEIKSPSRVMMKTAGHVVQGFINGISNNTRMATRSAETFGDSVFSTISKSLNNMPEIAAISDINPTITPILDLTNVEQGASGINSLFGSNKINAMASTNQANALSTLQATRVTQAQEAQQVSKEVKFEQNIYAPSALNAATIYRQTKSQIALAKEELIAV